MNDRLGQWFLKMTVLTATAGAIAIMVLPLETENPFLRAIIVKAMMNTIRMEHP